MANWSQSQFLQSLGWATLNSFWQMALLWCAYLAINFVFKTSSGKKYQLATGAVIAGFLWFIATFLYYLKNSTPGLISFFEYPITETNRLLNTCLLSAAMAYLLLLTIPTYRFFRNWQFVQRIKKQGLKKADLTYRLFVQKISVHLKVYCF